MAFSDQVELNGQGAVWKLDISLDGFSSISYRYSTAAGIDASNDYDPRIIGLGQLSRRLGDGHQFETTSIAIAIANDDELADWMVDRANAADVMKARARLYLGLYYTTNPAGGVEWKQVGEFVFGEFPRRTVDRINAVLSDATFGAVSEVTPLPTLGDWYDADSSGTTNPLQAGSLYETPESLAAHPPLQLAFGADWVPIDLRQLVTIDDSGTMFLVAPVCVTTSSAAVAANDITEVYVYGRLDFTEGGLKYEGFKGEVPSAWTSRDTGASATVWEAQKGLAISKEGKSFRVLWLKLYLEPFASWMADLAGLPTDIKFSSTDLKPIYQVIEALWVKGYPLSGITNTTTANVHPVDVFTDLVSSYSLGAAATVDSTALARVKSAYDAGAGASGVVRAGDQGQSPSLREVLEQLAASFDLDPMINWEGEVALTGRLLDYSNAVALASLRTIDEPRIDAFEEALPSREQRGSPFTRVALIGQKKDGVDYVANAMRGPSTFDDPAGTVTTWGRVLTKDAEVSWRTEADGFQNPWGTRNIDTTFRPVVRFKTDLSAVLLELGDYVKLNWTRNLGDPYTDAIFWVVGLTLNPEDHTVDVEAMWADELATESPYLLDDETYLLKVASSGGRTVTVTDSSDTVTFSSGDLKADGVEAGDHLILKDSTEGATSFSRNKVLRITAVPDATHAQVSDPLDNLYFAAGGGVAVANWEIRRSHLTYPTLATDPTNYPDGGDMYGRVSSDDDGTGTYSGAGTGGFTEGHKLLDG